MNLTWKDSTEVSNESFQSEVLLWWISEISFPIMSQITTSWKQYSIDAVEDLVQLVHRGIVTTKRDVRDRFESGHGNVNLRTIWAPLEHHPIRST